MSFFLADSDGFVQDVSTAKGWADVVLTLEPFIKLKGTPLTSFLNDGTTDTPLTVAEEINHVLPFIDNQEIKSTLWELQDGLRKCKDIAIITQ